MKNKTLPFNVCIAFMALLMLTLPLQGRSFSENSPPDAQKDFNILSEKIKKNPRDVASINSLGILYARMKQLQEAVKLWRYALQINPRYLHLYNNLGSAYKQMGRRAQARIVFKSGLSISESHWIYYNLGLLEQEDGNVVAAANCFKNSLRLQPDFVPAERRLMELGYNLGPSRKKSKLLSLGSYKHPVSMNGNIGFQRMLPNGGRKYGKTGEKYKALYGNGARNNLREPFKPLGLASCTEIIKSFKAEKGEKYIALTFDDGPHQENTAEILKVLNKNKVKATFFVVGTRAQLYPEVLARISQAGHALGNHSWYHKSLAKQTKSRSLDSLQKTNDLISGITGKPCYLVRPPYGHTNEKVKKLIHEQGWHEVMWDCDSRDWENKDPDHILFRIMKSIAPGSIVLLHDIHPGAAGMLQTLITAFKKENYRFITIPELIKIKSGTS
ncbi:MAG: polysaccharide deacetylase family protein [Candidatus Rifleibacteriota bacterium]